MGLLFIFLSAILAFAIVLLFVAATLVLFCYLKKKRPNTRWNLVFAGGVFVLVLFIHCLCAYLATCGCAGPKEFDFKLVADGFKEIYALFGGMQFEGQNFDNDALGFATCLYFGSTAYLGIMYIILIASGISYPLYSYIAKLSYRLRLVSSYVIHKVAYFVSRPFVSKQAVSKDKPRKKLCIFTYATKESLTLANSIANEYKDAIIIFSSDELEPFDKDNSIHFEIMQMNYPYIRLRKNDKKRDTQKHKNDGKKKNARKSIIGRIFCFSGGSKGLIDLAIDSYDVSIFALKTYATEKSEGNESKNSDIAFDDMRALLLQCEKEAWTKKPKKELQEPLMKISEEVKRLNEDKKALDDKDEDEKKEIEIIKGKIAAREKKRRATIKKWIDKTKTRNRTPIIHYYVLSNHDINFEFYENRKKEITKEHLVAFSKDGYDNIIEGSGIYEGMIDKKKEIPFAFDILVLNEAVLAAEDLIAVRHKGFNAKGTEKNKNDIDDIDDIITEENGEPLINYLPNGHHNLTIGFGQRGQAALCHLFVDSTGGKLDKDLFFAPTAFHAEVIDRDADAQIAPFIATHPSFVCSRADGETINIENHIYDDLKRRYGGPGGFQTINRLMAFPTISYRTLDYNSPAFLQVIESICSRNYDSVIIALGNDEDNIKCANAVLQSLRQSFERFSGDKKLQIFVNISDRENNHRLQWDQGNDRKIAKNVFVYSFGRFDKLYSASLIDDSGAIEINDAYDRIDEKDVSSNSKSKAEFMLETKTFYDQKSSATAYKFEDVYERYVDKHDECVKKSDCGGTLKSTYYEFRGMIEKHLAGESGDDSCVTAKSEKECENKTDSVNAVSCLRLIEEKGYYYFDSESIGEKYKTMCAAKLQKEVYDADNKEKELIPVNFANYIRIKENKAVLSKPGNVYRAWRYLAQYEHNRWCRYEMIHGKAFIKELKIGLIADKKYWKNTLKLHNCLLPYSPFTDFSSSSTVNEGYLSYETENYDYAIVVAALNRAKKDKNRETKA